MQPNAEMSYCHVGFDLKAAREICIKLDLRYPARSLVDIDYQCALAAEMLPAALDEIEQLRKALALKIEQHKGQAHVIGSYLGMLTDFNELNESQAKHIAELEEENRQLVRQILTDDDKDQLIAKQRAALKKLGQVKQERGKALVEERANLIEAGGEPTRRRLLKEDEEDLYDLAREQLRREGKL